MGVEHVVLLQSVRKGCVYSGFDGVSGVLRIYSESDYYMYMSVGYIHFCQFYM